MIYVVRYLLASLYTVFWATVVMFQALFDHSGESELRSARHWARWILRSCRVEVDVEGLEHIVPGETYVVMTNHQSVFDIPALVVTLPFSWRFVAKRELARIPFFGWGMVASGHIVIDRGQHESAIRTMREAAARVRGGTNVIVFPEGTRSKTGIMRSFKSGGFHLAIQAGVPILPGTISGSRRITPSKSLRVESGRILVRYAPPIPTAGLTTDDIEKLKQRLAEVIQAGFEPSLQD